MQSRGTILGISCKLEGFALTILRIKIHPSEISWTLPPLKILEAHLG